MSFAARGETSAVTSAVAWLAAVAEQSSKRADEEDSVSTAATRLQLALLWLES